MKTKIYSIGGAHQAPEVLKVFQQKRTESLLCQRRKNVLAESMLIARAHNVNKLHHKIQNGTIGRHLFELKECSKAVTMLYYFQKIMPYDIIIQKQQQVICMIIQNENRSRKETDIRADMRKMTIPIFIAIALAMLCVVFILIYGYLGASRFKLQNLVLEKLNLVGEYKIGENGTYYELTDNTKIIANAGETVYFYGHLNMSIPKNQQVILYLGNVKVKLFQNNTLLFSFGEDGTYFNYSKSPGCVYQSFISPGISKNDLIEIQITNIYSVFSNDTITAVLRGIYAGYSETLIKDNFAQVGFTLVMDIIIVGVGIALLIALIVLHIHKIEGLERYFYLSSLMISSGIWLFLNFKILWVYMSHSVFNNLLAFYVITITVISLAAYMNSFLQEKTKKILQPFLWFSILLVPVLILFSLTGRDVYDVINIYLGFSIITVFMSFACMCYDWMSLKDKTMTPIVYSVAILGFFGIIEIICFYDRSLTQNVALLIGLVIFFLIQYMQAIGFLIKMGKKAAESQKLENDLIRSNVANMLSQIQPHYIANTLNVISSLCDTNPQIVKTSIEHFAHYLRENINSLNNKDTNPFSDELSHIEHYLFLEKLDLEEKLNFVFNITAKCFMVPTLTIQPIVENAVKHGIARNKQGGTVRIETVETESDFLVFVIDNGAGFDVNETKNDGKSHIGIQNVQNRLQAICGGSMRIESEIGKGTTVTITIPKSRRKVDECDCC